MTRRNKIDKMIEMRHDGKVRFTLTEFCKIRFHLGASSDWSLERFPAIAKELGLGKAKSPYWVWLAINDACTAIYSKQKNREAVNEILNVFNGLKLFFGDKKENE